MNSVAADTAGATPASRPLLDRKPSRPVVGLFIFLLLAGALYTGCNLVSDINGALPQTTAVLPFILLGIALLTRWPP
ncbi:MAG: hypothetical protein PVS2B3_13600 [Steroidobacteraceae bacterium]